MRLWVIILASVLAVPLVLLKSAAHSPVTQMEQVQWLGPAQRELLEKQ